MARIAMYCIHCGKLKSWHKPNGQPIYKGNTCPGFSFDEKTIPEQIRQSIWKAEKRIAEDLAYIARMKKELHEKLTELRRSKG